MDMYKQLAELALATEATPLVLGGVEFWIDADGPWAGQLTYFPTSAAWSVAAISEDLYRWAKIDPAVTRIVWQFA